MNFRNQQIEDKANTDTILADSRIAELSDDNDRLRQVNEQLSLSLAEIEKVAENYKTQECRWQISLSQIQQKYEGAMTLLNKQRDSFVSQIAQMREIVRRAEAEVVSATETMKLAAKALIVSEADDHKGRKRLNLTFKQPIAPIGKEFSVYGVSMSRESGEFPVSINGQLMKSGEPFVSMPGNFENRRCFTSATQYESGPLRIAQACAWK